MIIEPDGTATARFAVVMRRWGKVEVDGGGWMEGGLRE